MFMEELKGASTSQMEEAISRAITELCGTKFTCSISTVEFSINHASLQLSLYREIALFGESTET